MDQNCASSSVWYRALTLTERIAFLPTNPAERLQMDIDADRGEQRSALWRSQSPFTSDDYFSRRLATIGVNEADFLHLLGEPIEALQERLPYVPSWGKDVTGAFEGFVAPAPSCRPLSEPGNPQGMSGFLTLLEPLIARARERLDAEVQQIYCRHSNVPLDPATISNVLFASLTPRLLQLVDRTLALELNVARLQGRLPGETAVERFQSFIRQLQQPDTALAILQEYSVLTRQVVQQIDAWVTFSLEFLQHLCDDWNAIGTAFNATTHADVLVELDGRAGDPHRGGRSVLIAKFRSGFQVVYKPRSLVTDVHFNELLSWANTRGAHPPFRTITVLDRGSYGWVEFVAARSCTSVDEVQRFYERQGSYLALLYMLEATDFHYANLIAAGEYPILVDLEALFHPRLRGSGGADPQSAHQAAIDALDHSVLRIGLLPHRLAPGYETDGIDVSGLGASEGQLTPFDVLQVQDVGKDVMRFSRSRVPMLGHQNRPMLGDIVIDAADYAEAIATGFARMYRLLCVYRHELLSGEGPVACFADDEVRIILRPTQTYGVLLSESFHPDVLRDALDRDRLFDWLWAPAVRLPYLEKIIPFECADLHNADIPIFTTRPNSRHLYTSTYEQIDDFFDESGLALVRSRLQQLSQANLEQQLWFVRASLATLTVGEKPAARQSFAASVPSSSAAIESEALLAASRAIGDRLATLAFRGTHDVTWIGLSLTGKGRWSLLPSGMDLYDGIPGVVLFLAYLGAATGEECYTSLARIGLAAMRRAIESMQSCDMTIGGFNGWGGIIYTLTHLGVLWNKDDVLAEAETLVERLVEGIDSDTQFDVISGASGSIVSLLGLYHVVSSERALAAAIRCGEHLLACAQPMAQGVGWVNPRLGAKPLTGFSHGAAGIAWSLMELAALTGSKRFQDVACAAMTYEQSLFSPVEGNWPDLRELEFSDSGADKGRERFMIAWCHGAPGIGLARLSIMQHLGGDASYSEIDVALHTTLAHGFDGNQSLCHGSLGNLELLLQASLTLDEARWCAEVHRVAARIVQDIKSDGWICGLPLAIESPGLMTGLAGIGYGLLRLAKVEQVPAVLLLAPPVLNTARH